MLYSLAHPVGFTALNVSSARHTLNSSSDKVPFSNAPSTCPSLPVSPSLSVSSAASTEFDCCPTPEEYSLYDLELMSVGELDEIMEDYYRSKKANVFFETEEKRLPKTRKFAEEPEEPAFSKVARKNDKTDVALERRRYAVLTESDAAQTESFKLEQAAVQEKGTKDPLVFNVKTLMESLPEEEKQKFGLQFEYVKKEGKCAVKSLEDYIQKILEQCDKQRDCLKTVDEKKKIYSSLLPLWLNRNLNHRRNRTKVWLQLDKQNHVVGLYRPSVRSDHCKKLLDRIIPSFHQIQPKLQAQPKLREIA